MSRTFKIPREPYHEGDKIYTKSTVTIEPGVTVLVGCNGSGKTTLLKHLETQLKKEKIPVFSFDNLLNGGSNAVSSAAFYDDFSFVSTAITSSEGENIVMNIGRMASNLRPFIKTGKSTSRQDQLANAFAKAVWGDDAKSKENNVPKERWLLFDAIDSGLSVNNVVEVKEYLFKTILADAGDCDIYILVSCNEYELAREENCFDVRNGKYIRFADYEEYRNFILKSAQEKQKRLDSFDKAIKKKEQ